MSGGSCTSVINEIYDTRTSERFRRVEKSTR